MPRHNERRLKIGNHERDEQGYPIPVWLESVFAGRWWLKDSWCERLSRLVDDLQRKSNEAELEAIGQHAPHLEWTKHIDVVRIARDLKKIIREVQQQVPFCRCPARDTDPDCPFCGGDGWVNSMQLTEAWCHGLKQSSLASSGKYN